MRSPVEHSRAFVGKYVSTGKLPTPDFVQRSVNEAYQRFRSHVGGVNSQVYPALTTVRTELLGICVAGAGGSLYEAGDAGHALALMSVSKPFVFALVCQSFGAARARELLGVNSTGLPFDSLLAVERGDDGKTNPMVNAGAIAATSLVPGDTAAEKWELLHATLSGFAGRMLSINEEVHASAASTNHRNRNIARLLQSHGRIYWDPDEVLDLYTRQCSLNVTATDLAVMGATLANGGVNPLTGTAVIEADACHYVLAVMATAGLYETSGDWLYEIGLPGKSGIGGGIVAVSPGKGALGTFASALDAAGNSVKGQLVAGFLSRRLGMDLFASRGDVRDS